MAKLTSINNSAASFKKCINAYLLSVGCNMNKYSVRFWELVRTARFENGKLSNDCKLYKIMKEYTESHPLTVWSVQTTSF